MTTTEVLIDGLPPSPPPPPILGPCNSPFSSPYHRHHNRQQQHLMHQSKQQLQRGSSRDSLRSREEGRGGNPVDRSASCLTSQHSPPSSCKLHGNHHRISSRLTSQESSAHDEDHREIHMIVRDHSLTRNQSPAVTADISNQVNDLNASPNRVTTTTTSFHHQNSVSRQNSHQSTAQHQQQHPCCSPSPPPPVLLPEDCFPEGGTPASPSKKAIRRIHFCPEFLKAMENVQFIADHTKKSEEDVDVSTFFTFLLLSYLLFSVSLRLSLDVASVVASRVDFY